jgi:molybdopterin molybdotransferase
MTGYEEALERILSLGFAPGVERLPLLEAGGRVLAGPVEAPWPLPRFDNSSMDGYAVRAADLERAPAELRLVGESAAGRAFEGHVGHGETVRISTGARIPAGADAVVPVELTSEAGALVQFTRQTSAGKYIRRLGSDVAPGSPLFAAGTRITPAVLSLLAYYNISDVEVFRRPRVGILTSGDEILPYGQTPTGSHIIGSSIYYLERELTACGCEARLCGIASDAPESFRELFARTLEWSDVIVTTAGVSVGDHDIVGRVVKELGGEILFWRVSVRPGKPFLLARFGNKVHFGFPGNPVSTCCNTEIFLKPFLRKTFGMEPAVAPTVRRRLAVDCPRDKARLFFVYARTEWRDGEPLVVPLANQNSGNLLLPAMADCLVVIPPGETALPEGATVDILELREGL